MSAADRCVKCDEPRGAIRRERLICWDGYDELGKHRFRPWPDNDSGSTGFEPISKGSTNG